MMPARGAVAREISCERRGARVEFTIRADGASIEQEKLTQSAGANSGIGLFLSERLIDLIGGSLSVKHEPKLTTSFQVTIPDRGYEEDR